MCTEKTVVTDPLGTVRSVLDVFHKQVNSRCECQGVINTAFATRRTLVFWLLLYCMSLSVSMWVQKNLASSQTWMSSIGRTVTSAAILETFLLITYLRFLNQMTILHK